MSDFLTRKEITYYKLSRAKPVNPNRELSLEQVSKFELDVVIHLAGRAHVLNETVHDPTDEYKKANIDYALNVANQAYLAGIKRFVFVSTVGVYGKYSANKPILETNQPKPVEAYAISKLKAEVLLERFCKDKGMELVILRPALIYGDYAPGNLQKLYRLCNKNIPLPFSSAVQKRTMLNIDTFCEALLLCSIKSEAAGKVYNVADETGVSTSQLVSSFKASLKKKDLQFFVPDIILQAFFKLLKKEKMYQQLFKGFELSSKKIQKELGWKANLAPKEALSSIKFINKS